MIAARATVRRCFNSSIVNRRSILFNNKRCCSSHVSHDESVPTIFSDQPPEGYMSNLRNIGISAHIDSGKTTLTERILFYCGKINAIHDVRGKDGVGAKMDSMDLEREKGITIQSAATFCSWGDNHINIIDTPGHVDFTIEVERALRVLDGGILVLCGVSGVQSQSLTVDRQMKRYGVPRIAFINKLDRQGANPWRVIEGIRKELKLNAAAVQYPIGLENDFKGVIDLVRMKALYNEGDNGEKVIVKEIPDSFLETAKEKRYEMIEKLADVDEEIADLFLMEQQPDLDTLVNSIRRNTINHSFVPVFMGSAYKNKSVQPLLDGVIDYLPKPLDRENYALDLNNNEERIRIPGAPDGPLLALAFKLEEGKYGQLTYMRIYNGKLKKGDTIFNLNSNKKIKVPRLAKMHSNEMQEVSEVSSGEVVAMFGVDCASMDTFSNSIIPYSMTSLHVPSPVMSLSIKIKDNDAYARFSKALNRFTKEDPTFTVKVDDRTKETVISGMGELHLDIYVERMRREYNLIVETGKPQVNYFESIRKKMEFNYLHKKQSGGSGQFARVCGYIEPLSTDEHVDSMEFVNEIVGNCIPPEYIAACEKGMYDATEKGWLNGSRLTGMRVVINDGQAHAVDSSELAFRTAMLQAIRQAFLNANPGILEPIMTVEVEIPLEFQGNIIGEINRRRGLINDTETDEVNTVVRCDVPLANMFGFSTELRSATQGKGEFSMEYKTHAYVPRDAQELLIDEYRKSQLEEAA